MSKSAARTIAFLIVMLAMFVGSTFRSNPATVTLALIAVFIASVRGWNTRRSPAKDRGTLLSLVKKFLFVLSLAFCLAACGFWRSMAEIPLQQGRVQGALDIAAHAFLTFQFVIWMARPLHGHHLMLPSALLIITVCVFAGGASTSQAAQTSVALASCAGFCLAAHILLGAKSTPPDRSIAEHDDSPFSLKPLLLLLTLSLLLMATSVVAGGTRSVLPYIQRQLQEHLQVSLNMTGDDQIIGGTRYVRGSTLGSVRKAMINNPQEIALTVHCEALPGYLRGNAFDTYRRRKWMTIQTDFMVETTDPELLDRHISPSKTATRKAIADKRLLKLSTFLVNEPTGPTVELEIYNDPMKGTVVFLPQATNWIEAKSNELTLNPHGIVRLGIDMSEPYIAVASPQLPREPLSAQRRRFLLDLPPSTSDFLLDFADGKWGGLDTAQAKANAVSSYLRQNHEYSLDLPQVPRGVDPVVNFLASGHAAHCEYFATATVMLLRSLGVPARYITGYVVDEYNTDDEFWVARNLDAHAWVEAYDEQNQTWFAVESTPGRQYQTISDDSPALENEGLFDVFYTGGDDYGDSLLGRALGWLLSIRVTDPLMILFRVAQLPLFCVVVFVIWTRFVRPRSAENHDIASRRMLKQADRQCRKHQMVRARSETLNQFADRLDAFCQTQASSLADHDLQRIQRLPEWYRQFASARYQGNRPNAI